MEYKGKLYGKIGGVYFDTSKTSEDWDNLENKVAELQDVVNKNCTIPVVSGSLLRNKAKDYAKFKHQDEYDDPIYHRDVLETLNDFEAGYKAAMKDCNER